jgi:very-short-patch-repair endonuclease
VIEVDDAYHDERGLADARRDAALERAGYRVVRVEASLVVSDVERAVAEIRAALSAVNSAPQWIRTTDLPLRSPSLFAQICR